MSKLQSVKKKGSIQQVNWVSASLTLLSISLSLALPFLFFISIAVQPAHAVSLDAGGAQTLIRANTRINFGGSHATVSEVIYTNRLRVNSVSGWAAFHASTAPAYILGWPYTYSSALLNITAPTTAKSASLSIVTSGLGSDGSLKIYRIQGTDAILNVAPSFDALLKQLTVTATGTVSTLTVSTGTYNKPSYISMDGAQKQENQGWTWNNGLVQITQSAGTYLLVFGGGGGGGGDAGGGGGGGGGQPAAQQPAAEGGLGNITKALPGVIAAAPREIPSNLIMGGSLAIAFIIAVALVAKEAEKRVDPASKWDKTLKSLNKPVKWKKRKT